MTELISIFFLGILPLSILGAVILIAFMIKIGYIKLKDNDDGNG